jgi:hypothetical protein
MGKMKPARQKHDGFARRQGAPDPELEELIERDNNRRDNNKP